MSSRPPPSSASSGLPLLIIGLVACLAAAPVLVAVVGIVAAIAIPNYLKYQCRSKQSEAKVNLAGLYVAEKAFFGEYGFYTTDLKAIGWAPDGEPRYLYGFSDAGAGEPPPGVVTPSDHDPERKDTSAPSLLGASYSTARMRDAHGMPLDPLDLPPEAVVDGESFVAAAIGDLDYDGGIRGRGLDVWTIDDQKRVIVQQNDCSN